MPTYSDPLADAAEAGLAVQALAHASRDFPDPGETLYRTTGELLGALRSLEQVLGQVADAHIHHQDRAFLDNGNHEAGVDEAWAAANALRKAAELVQSAETAVDRASQHSSHIAWHPESAAEKPLMDPFSRDPFDSPSASSRRGLSL